MSVKTKRKAASDQQQRDLIDKEREAEESAEKKLLHVWQSFDQIYGKRWTENFGNDPLGKYKDPEGRQNPRMDLWLEAVKYMSWPQIKQTIRKITENPKESDWWIPDLQAFKQFARTAAPSQSAQVEPQRPIGSWVTTVCNIFLLRTIAKHGPFSPSSIQLLTEATHKIAAAYDQMRQSGDGDIPEDVTAETKARCEEVKLEIQAMLTKRYATLKMMLPTPEEQEQMIRHLRGVRAPSPTQGNSSLPTPTGSLDPDAPLSSD